VALTEIPSATTAPAVGEHDAPQPLPPPPTQPVVPPNRPEAPRATGALRLLSLFEVILCSGYPTQLGLSAIFFAAGALPLDISQISIGSLSLLLLTDALLVTGLAVLFLRARGERATDVFLGWRRPSREAWLGLLLLPLLFLLVVSVAFVVERAAPWLHNVTRNPFEPILKSPLHTAIFGIVAVVAGGVREELQRAFILHRFEQHLGGARVGLVLFSAIFGVGHVLQGYDAAIVTALFGLLWGLVYLRRRSVVAPIVSHAAFNAIEVVAHSLWIRAAVS
jgi:membrane protease YdiL (CAAX protease family)